MWRRFRAEGIPIVASWIDEDGPGQTASMTDLWERIGQEVTSSRGVVLYVEPADLPLKGAYVEVGMALILGKPVGVVVPHYISDAWIYGNIGSWTKHRLVTRYATVAEAFEQMGKSA